jgi:hypothetical protein
MWRQSLPDTSAVRKLPAPPLLRTGVRCRSGGATVCAGAICCRRAAAWIRQGMGGATAGQRAAAQRPLLRAADMLQTKRFMSGVAHWHYGAA